MPESTCLHIQDQESGPIRVVDIPWISVRIGRAAFCEVRLTSDELADEACRLYRRGRSWHLVPVGAKGEILVEGRSVSASCPLPFDVPFQVGRHCLTLRHDRTVDPDWQMYPGPVPARPNWSGPPTKDVRHEVYHAERTATIIDSHPVALASLKPEWRPQPTAEGPVPTREHTAGASVKDRWETRWRAAGAELKARSERSATRRETPQPAYKTGFDSVPLKEPPVPRAQPREAPVPRAQPTARPSVDLPPQQTLPTPRAATVESSWTVPTSESDEPRPPSLSSWDHSIADDKAAEALGIDLAVAEDSLDLDVGEDRRDHSTADGPDGIETVADENPFADGPPLTTNEFEAESNALAADESSYELPALPPPRRSKSGRQGASVRKRPAKEQETADADRAKHATSRGRKHADGRKDAPVQARTERAPRPLVANQQGDEASPKLTEMPSAKDILATHETRRNTQAMRLQAGRPGQEVRPTLARPPDQWALPAWVAGPPAAAFVLAVGLAAGILSWWWTDDSYAVAIMTERLLAADRTGRRGALPETVAPPDGTWTRSTAQHLAHWAIFMSLIEPGNDPSPDDVAALSRRALAVSPLNPTARLALAQLDKPENGAAFSPRDLGLSRDAVSLSWCARQLLAAGNKEGALTMYAKALAVLMPDEPFRIATPRFSDDPNAPRYLLPGEERVREIVREILATNEWALDEWSAALPKNALARLAAARLLKEQGRSEADGLLEFVVDTQEPLEGAKPANAVGQAARAEAFALKSRWKESEQSYRLAIELIEDETVKRSWWFNLADIELRMDDESQWQTALKAAMAVSPADDISREATKIQREYTGRANGRPLNARANGVK